MLAEFGDRIIVAEHHKSDVLDIPWTRERATLYGVVALPRVWFDGLTSVGGVTTCSQAAGLYRTAIQDRLAQNGGLSPVEIAGSWAHDDETVTLTATFRKVEATPLLEAHAQLLLLENDIPYDGIVYRRVTRAAYDRAVTLESVGDSVVVTADFPIEEIWDPGQIEAIAFLQRIGETYEVYQTARLPEIEELLFAFEDPIAGVPEGSGLARFHGVLSNPSEQEDTLTVELENTFGWLTQFMIEGESEYHGSPSVIALGAGASRTVDLRAITDDERRVGTEHLDITSARTGRTHRARARIFNGSPAILLVDDDRSGTEELEVQAALDARGYLYDGYEVFVTHIDEGPSAARLSAYDVVLWHTGWSSYDLIPPVDVAALTACMAGGGALLLSSQDCLSEMSAGSFTRDCLGLNGWTLNVGANAAQGVPGDPIGDGLDFALDYETGIYNRADDLVPASSASVILNAEGSHRIALRNDNGTARAVFLGFGLNAMSGAEPDPNNPATLLDRSIRWLIERTDVAVPDPAPGARASRICAVQPNPGGAGPGPIAIRLRLSARAADGDAWLDIVDLAGRRVRRLRVDPARPGSRSLVWDGRDAAGRRLGPGLYCLELATRDGRDHARLMIVR
jgi:hypothetical protein